MSSCDLMAGFQPQPLDLPAEPNHSTFQTGRPVPSRVLRGALR